MSDKAKALAILAGIGSFYILLSIIESFEWRHVSFCLEFLLISIGQFDSSKFTQPDRLAPGSKLYGKKTR